MKKDKIRKSYIQHTLIATAIFSIIILHFVSQFTFFQNAELRSERIAPRNLESKTNVGVKTEVATTEPERVKAATEPAVPATGAAAAVGRAGPKIAPARVIIKKREARESRAERLRRAEKLLTGV